MLHVAAADRGRSGVVKRTLEPVAVARVARLTQQPGVAVHKIADVTRLCGGVWRDPGKRFLRAVDTVWHHVPLRKTPSYHDDSTRRGPVPW